MTVAKANPPKESRVSRFIQEQLTHLGVLTARPAAFGVVVLYAIAWAAISPETLDWHGAATIATWMMTLVIQRAEHRDTQAIHVKLDELLHAQQDAHNQLTRVDDKQPEEIEQLRERQRRGD